MARQTLTKLHAHSHTSREEKGEIKLYREESKTEPPFPPAKTRSNTPSPPPFCVGTARNLLSSSRFICLFYFLPLPPQRPVYFPPTVGAAATGAAAITGAGVVVVVAVAARPARRFDRSICVRMVLARYEMSRMSWMWVLNMRSTSEAATFGARASVFIRNLPMAVEPGVSPCYRGGLSVLHFLLGIRTKVRTITLLT